MVNVTKNSKDIIISPADHIYVVMSECICIIKTWNSAREVALMDDSPHPLQPSTICHLQRKLAFQLSSFFTGIEYFLFPWQEAFSGSQGTIWDI